MDSGLTLSSRSFLKVIAVVAAFFFAAPVRAQENGFRFPFSTEQISAVVPPAPSRPAADHCAALPQALAAADSNAYDAQTISCFGSLVSIPDYVSPLAAVPAPAQLAKEEEAALDKYVDSYAYIVNAALRKGEDVSKYRKFIKTLNSALGKMPAYSGVTFRGSAFPPLPPEKLKPGAVFIDPAFLSTSRNLTVAEGYTGAGGYLSVMLSKTGRILAYNNFLNGLEAEMEVLFPTGTKLRVLSVSDNPKGGKTIYLEELL